MLPTPMQREWLWAALQTLVDRRGAARLLEAPIVLRRFGRTLGPVPAQAGEPAHFGGVVGPKRSVTTGILIYAAGLLLFAGATEGWMMFAIMVPYCFGGIAGPALQGIMSNQVPPNEQGELQGGLTSLISVTSIIGPLLMTNLFAFFTGENSMVHFPGMPFAAGAFLCILSAWFALRTLNKTGH